MYGKHAVVSLTLLLFHTTTRNTQILKTLKKM